MITKTALLAFSLLLAHQPTPPVHARSIPPNLQSFYNAVTDNPCSRPIQGGFEDGHGNPGFSYCGDYKGLIYISGPKSQPLGDMDIDCDGTDNSAGQCADDPSGQSQTSFRSTAIPYGVPDLNSSVHSYVVFGNEGDKPSFDPMEAGMEPLSVMAVVCNNNLFYGVWGDKNEGIYVGEASISLAAACFPRQNISGDKGYTGHDVLFLGFTGKNAAPGGNGADWNARSFGDFEASLAPIGNKLVAKLSESPEKTSNSTWKPNSGSGSGSNSNSNSNSKPKSGQARMRSWNGVCLSVLLVISAIV